jgi:diaminohydroxyphosphoribosylaminopyrimidine deaminase / 5-amino-6-(5-phosphoribosylamino)uracil reductase
VSGPPARSYVFDLRSQCDAVIVGTNTVNRDNPQLTSHRDEPRHNPLRVVMSRSFKLPEQARLWQTEVAPTVVFTEGHPNPALEATLQQQQVEVVSLPQLTPKAVMQNLYKRGCATVLWECGGTLSAEAIAQGCIQKILAFIAPKIIGGQLAPSPIGELGFTQMTEAIALKRLALEQMGQDYLLTGYLPE